PPPVDAPALKPPVAAVQAPASQPSSAAQDGSPADRWAALERHDWERALKQGAAYRTSLKEAWVLRLEVACQPDTLARVVSSFKAPADLFLVPMAMKDGRTCHQVCFGHFSSQAE